MKKYLPSVEEIIPGVIIIVIGFLVWSIVGTSLTSAIDKVKSKVSPGA